MAETSLTKEDLRRCWEASLDEMHNTIKQPHESNQIYLARCWSEGIFKALKARGYKVCIEKPSKESL